MAYTIKFDRKKKPRSNQKILKDRVESAHTELAQAIRDLTEDRLKKIQRLVNHVK